MEIKKYTNQNYCPLKEKDGKKYYYSFIAYWCSLLSDGTFEKI